MLFFVAVRYIMQAIELLVPALIMLAIGGIKSGINPKELDASTPIADTPIVTYEAMQNVSTFPNVLCYDNNMFMRCYDVMLLFWESSQLIPLKGVWLVADRLSRAYRRELLVFGIFVEDIPKTPFTFAAVGCIGELLLSKY